MKKLWLLFLILSTISCSTVPVFKQSPEVATTAAAIKDSLDAARVDLADKYTETLNILLAPPEKRIQIVPIINDGKRVVVIPEKYKNDNIVAIGTDEWNKLLKIKEISLQLATDKANLNAELNSAREELLSQQRVKEQLAADNITLTQDNIKAQATIFRRTAYLIGLSVIMCIYLYIKIHKKIVLPL